MAREGDAEADALHAYLLAISKLPRLTVDEERELGLRVMRDQDEAALRRLVKVTPVNSVPIRREIAARCVESGGYPFI